MSLLKNTKALWFNITSLSRKTGHVNSRTRGRTVQTSDATQQTDDVYVFSSDTQTEIVDIFVRHTNWNCDIFAQTQEEI